MCQWKMQNNCQWKCPQNDWWSWNPLRTIGCRYQQEVYNLIISLISLCLLVVFYSGMTILFCKVQCDKIMFPIWRSISVDIVFAFSLTWKNLWLDLSMILGCGWFLHENHCLITHCFKREKSWNRTNNLCTSWETLFF